MSDSIPRPLHIGGPQDGEALDEPFPEGHPLHGKLPTKITYPDKFIEGLKHNYRFVAGSYVYEEAS